MIGPSAILSAARKMLGIKTRSIGFDGAAGGRRMRNAGSLDLPLSSQVAARQTLARRARYLAANNGYAAAGTSAWESALVGTGIKPQSAHSDPAIRKIINARFDAWCAEADADGIADFYGMQAMIARRMVVDGEIFAAFAHNEIGTLRVRLMDGEQVNGAYHTELAAGSRIVGGVEFDERGARVAYHVWKQRPGLPIMASLDLIRLPAEDVCHIFKPETPGQVRGISWFAPVLLRLADLDTAHDAQLMRQKIASLLAGFITDPNGTEPEDFEGKADGLGNLDGGLEPGTLKVLSPGQSIVFSSPAAIGREAIDFLKITAREISSGIGVPYEQLSNDLSSVNYSSIRAGLVEFRRRAEAIQFNVMVHRFCRPVWRRFITAEILAGRLDAPGFERDPESYLAARWLPPKVDWVDPKKDVEAEILAIGAGLMSRRQAVASRGFDLEELDAEIAADRRDANALGLTFSTVLAPAAATEEATQ